ncbi:DUF5615 family PIN-like protein [candidate division KSB1 bacterium]|nr:DUF5615 family PIN-like protein [candidate division KSB1 bacterium]
MLFISDANIFIPMVKGLRALGHDVYDIKEQNLDHLPDDEIYKLARKMKRVILTMDKDFCDILLYPPGEHYGIIVTKLYGLTVNHATEVFLQNIRRLKEHDITGHIVIIDRNKIRIRKEK